MQGYTTSYTTRLYDAVLAYTITACTLIKCLSWINLMALAQWAMLSAVLEPSQVFLRAFHVNALPVIMHVYLRGLTLTTSAGWAMQLAHKCNDSNCMRSMYCKRRS